MSQDILMLATRDYLRPTLELTPGQLDIMADGQPPPMAGEFFVAIHQGEWSATDIDNGLWETLGLQITVSWRISKTPKDRWGVVELAKANVGLLALLNKIKAAVHFSGGPSYPIHAIAAKQIGVTFNSFVEPLRFRSGGSPAQRVGGEWFGGNSKGPSAGLVQTLTFGGCVRVQSNVDGIG